MAQPLKDAGLHRVTVSMDAVDPDRFARITRVPTDTTTFSPASAPPAAWPRPVKVNCVLLRGFNEDQIIPFGMFAREEGVVVRFIEFMPLEEDRIWTPRQSRLARRNRGRMAEYKPLVEIAHEHSAKPRAATASKTASEKSASSRPSRSRSADHCSRIRLTSDGKIRTCLFSVWDHDLHGEMRRGATDDDLRDFIREVVEKKEARHHIGEPDFVPASRTMVHIGG